MDFFLDILLNVIVWSGEPLFYSALGLVVGWNVLAQPAWVKSLYDKVRAKIKGV